MARTVCRRVERHALEAFAATPHGQDASEGVVLTYLNRLSDYLFMLARYVPCLSEGAGKKANGFSGRVTEFLRQMPVAGAYDFYLCGRQAMVHEAYQIIDERFDQARIHSEVFY